MAMAIAMMVVAPMPVNTQCAVYRSHPRADGTADNGANRSSGSIAFMCALLCTAHQPLSLRANGPRQHGEKSDGEGKTQFHNILR
jgi:hypothetical protein